MALFPGKSWAQTGIGTGGTAPTTSAMLEVKAADKGVLLPRLSLLSTTDAATIVSPATSLLVWNTNNALTGGAGYYFNAGTTGLPNWVKLVTNAPGDGTGNEWKLGGNLNTTGTVRQLGTNDAFDLPLVTNSTEKARLTTTGRLGIGTTTPQSTLEVAGSLGANYAQVTDATYTITNLDFYAVYNGTTPGTFTLPTAVGVKGRLFYLKNTTTAQTLTIAAPTGEGINGTTTLTIPAGQSVQLITSGVSTASTSSYEIVAFNSATAIGGPKSASNGLTLLGTDIQLGGQLTKNTVLDGVGAYTLGLTNTTLGVGVAAPGATLHIYGVTTSGSPGGTGAEVLLGTGTLTKGASVQIVNDGSFGSSLLFNVKKGSNQGVTGADNWPTNATTAMRVGAAGGGNVGIGTFSTLNPVNSGALLHLSNSSTSGTQQQGFLPPTVDFTPAVFAAATTWGLAGTPVNGMQVSSNTVRMDAGFAGPGIYTWVMGVAGTPTTTSTWRRFEYGTGMSPALATLNCTGTLQPNGIYVSGQPLTSVNTVLVPVTVTQLGTYSISTPVTNGYAFTGIGTFSATGSQNITLTASGTPTNGGTDNFTITLGGTTCAFAVGVGGQLAAFASYDCATATPATGTYQSTTPTTAANTKTITVAVTTGGAYSISTGVVNGVTFSATGSFADASAGTGSTNGTTQTVVLRASGTPQQAPVTNSFIVNGMGGTSCTFTVPVIAAPVVATLVNCATPGADYRIKASTGSAWVYPNGDVIANGTNTVLAGSTTGVARQWSFVNTSGSEYVLVNGGQSTGSAGTGGSMKVLTVAGGGSSNTTPLQLSDYTSLASQRFTVTTISGTPFTGAGVVEIVPTHATGTRVDINGGGTAPGTTVSLYSSNGSGSQRFNLEPVAITLTSGTAVAGTTNRFTVGYTGGNGGTYATQTVSSTGVQGLTATLATGVLNGTLGTTAPGFLTFNLSGTPTSAGNATFAVSLGSLSCSVSMPVVLQDAVVASLNCGSAVTTGTVATGAALSGVSTSVPYTSGNGGKYSAISIASLGVFGLTATASAGALATGNGNLVLNITGTPSGDGSASFALTLGGQSCNFVVTVTRTPVVASFSNCATPAFDYRIKVNDAPFWLSSTSDAMTTSSPIVQSSTSNTTNQQWQFVLKSSNNYYVRHVASGRVWDLSNASTSNNTPVNALGLNSNNNNAQRWSFANVSTGTAFTGGNFQIASGIDGGKAIDLSGIRANGTAIYIYDGNSGNTNQRFVLEPVATLTAGTNATGYNVTLAYANGNGAPYPAITGITSTGITGLTASLAAGTLSGTVAAPLDGFLTFVVTGTPSAAGSASFNISFGGQTCTMVVPTQGPAVITSGSLACGTASAGTLSAGVAASGVTQTISYTGGNTGQYTISAPSTGVTGLTASASGSTTSGSGSIVLSISGIPNGGGTATFTITLGSETCTFTRNVTAGTVTAVTNAAAPGLDYYIKSNASTTWVYPINDGTTTNTPVAVSTTKTGLNRQWTFVNVGNANDYAICNAATGLSFNVNGGNSTSNGNGIAQYPWATGDTNSRFKLNAISGPIFGGGVMGMNPSYSTAVRLDVSTGGTNNSQLQIYQNNSTAAQQYILEAAATLSATTGVSNARFTLLYTGGSGTYAALSSASTGVTGLTATATAGTFNGSNFLVFTVTGTPSGSGTATFPLTIGGVTTSAILTIAP